MGTLLTLLTLGAGLGGLGFWLARRDDRDSASPPAQAPPLALPPAADDAPDIDPNGTRYVPPLVPAPPPPMAPAVPPHAPTPATVRAIAPSDFVLRMRGWLEQGPPATQIELVASHLEQAGHRETAAQLRALASERRAAVRANAEAEAAPSGPPEPASPPAPDGSPGLSPEFGSDNSPSIDDGSGARSEPSASPDRERQLRTLARRVAAMLHARQGQGTDRRLVRQFQVAARLFPSRGDNPSGLYGPVTRAALARYGVRNPPRPRFRAEVEAAPPRTRPARPARSPRPNPNRPSSAR